MFLNGSVEFTSGLPLRRVSGRSESMCLLKNKVDTMNMRIRMHPEALVNRI